MKWALIGFQFFAGFAMAADPVYPKSTVTGYVVRDFDEFNNLTFKPGTLSDCKSSGSGGFTSYSCTITGAELIVEIKGTDRVFPITGMSAYEMAGTATSPEYSNYYFSGVYGMILPDGTPYDTTVSISFNRSGTNPDRLSGNFEVYSLGIQGGIVANWPADPPAAKN